MNEKKGFRSITHWHGGKLDAVYSIKDMCDHDPR